MKIVTITGKTKSDELTVTKSIGALILAMSIPANELLNEKITVYIERGNGNNLMIANKVLLRDFLLSSSYGVEALQSSAQFDCIAICELAVDGGIFLAEKESIKISFDDLRAPNTYEVYGIEEPNPTNTLYMWEQKTVAVEDFSKKIDVRGFDLAVMTTDASVSDLLYTFSEGQVVKYLPFELQTMSRDQDPIQAILKTGVVLPALDNRVTLPLVDVASIEVNKSQGSIINFVMRAVKNVQ